MTTTTVEGPVIGATDDKGPNMLLTVKDLTDRLRVKPSTLYAWAAGGKIPCVKLHGLALWTEM